MRSLIRYLESLTVTQGEGAGEPIRLLPWQRRFVRGAFAIEGDSALSVGRGNGKTTLVSGIAAAALDGPLAQARADTVVVASSFQQARIAYEHTVAFLAARGHDVTDRARWRAQDSANLAALTNLANGARVRCIGSDPKRAHGLAPAYVIADEPSQWESSKADAMLAALRTAMGKIPGSRVIALGTRPADESHWFERMLRGGCDFAQVHAAGPDDPPFQRRTWRKANPSLSVMPALEKRIRREARDAKRDPSMLAAFQALRLNLGLSDTLQSTLLDAGTWARIEGEAPPDGPPVWGCDLGTSEAMSAIAAFWPKSGRLECFAALPHRPDLRERGLADGVGRLYLDMARRGELLLAGERVSDIAELLGEARARWGRPSALVCDRWREAELREKLEQAGIPRCELVVRGQGFKDGGEDVRAFRRACVAGRVVPARSLLLRAAMGFVATGKCA